MNEVEASEGRVGQEWPGICVYLNPSVKYDCISLTPEKKYNAHRGMTRGMTHFIATAVYFGVKR
jgi:hypothetical protein